MPKNAQAGLHKLSKAGAKAAVAKAGIVLVEEKADGTWDVLAPFTIGKFGSADASGALRKYYTLGKGSVDEDKAGNLESLWDAAVREFEEETGISIQTILEEKRKDSYRDGKARIEFQEVIAGKADGTLIHIKNGDFEGGYPELENTLLDAAGRKGVVGCQHIMMPSSQGYVNEQHLFLVKVKGLNLLKKHCKFAKYADTPLTEQGMAKLVESENLPPVEDLIGIMRTGRVPMEFYTHYIKKDEVPGKYKDWKPLAPKDGIAEVIFKDPLLPHYEELYFRKKAEQSSSSKPYDSVSPPHITDPKQINEMFEMFSGDGKMNELRVQMDAMKGFLKKKMGLFQDSVKGLKLDAKYGLNYVIEGAEVLPFASPPTPVKAGDEQPRSYISAIEHQAHKSALYDMMMFNRIGRDPITYQPNVAMCSAVDSLMGMAGRELPNIRMDLQLPTTNLLVSGAEIKNPRVNAELLNLLKARYGEQTKGRSGGV